MLTFSKRIGFLSKDPTTIGLYLAAFLFMLVFFVWPLFTMVAASVEGPFGLSFAYYVDFLSRKLLINSFWNSLMMAVVSTGSATVVGFLFAYAMTRVDMPGKRFFKGIVILQLISLPFTVGLSFVMLFGRRGLITYGLLGRPFEIYGWHGLWMVQTLTFFPLAYLVLVGVLKSIDPALEYAARNLGARDTHVFKDVVLPLSIPGVASAALLVAMNVLGDFGNPALIAGDFTVIATEAYMQIVGWGNFRMAAVLCNILFLPVFVLFIAQKYWVSRKVYVTVTGAPTQLGIRKTGRLVKWSLFSFCLIVSSVIVLIYASIGLGGFVRTWGADYSFTTLHLDYVIFQGIPAIENVLIFSLTSGFACAILGVLDAYIVFRKRMLGRQILDFISTLPAAVPGFILGIGYILSFNTPPLILTATPYIIILNNIARDLPTGFQAGMAGIQQIDVSIEEASVNLGAGTFQTLRNVALPLLKSALGAGFIYSFIKCMTTVSAVIFLITPKWNLPSPIILGLASEGYWGQAAALSTILLTIVVGTLLVCRAVAGRRIPLFEV